MERTSGPQGKGIFLRSRFGRCVFLVGLCSLVLVITLWVNIASSVPAFAATPTPSPSPVSSPSPSPAQNVFAVSPTQGPVGAVISVSATGVVFPDGTQVNLGYTADYHTCNLVSGGQSGIVHTGDFSGWFRWPTSTAVGTFGVCAIASGLTFQIGSYQVLSASTPRVSVAPAKVSAGQQATVSGANFLPGGTSVNLIWHAANGGHSVQLGTVSSNQAGTFAYTFTVPAHASTGSYSLTGAVGSGSPPVLSAVTTFHVDGVTLVAVPTPTVAPKPTSVPTSAPTAAPATVTPQIVSAHQSANTNVGESGNGTNVFVPIALGGGLLIALALGAGVLIVRRQRRLIAATSDTASGTLLWPEATDMVANGVNAGAGAFAPWPGYPDSQVPAGNPGREYSPEPGQTLPNAVLSKAAPIPFDPGLVEAMREAQVSLFATPRPPASEEIEVQS